MFLFTGGFSMNSRSRSVLGAAIAIILVPAIIGVGSIVMHGGLNYGIDFKGGYKFMVEFTDPVDLGQVRSTGAEMGLHHAGEALNRRRGGGQAPHRRFGRAEAAIAVGGCAHASGR